MAYAVGSVLSISTWGKFRHVWRYKVFADYEAGNNWFYYPDGLKSAAAGSGLIRGLPWFGWGASGPGGFFLPVEFFNQEYTTGGSPPFPVGNRMFANPLYNNSTLETQAELTGETVTFQDFRTGVIPASFWTTGVYVWDPESVGGIFAGDEIDGITKLQRF
jgi:hypothetical protein